MTAMLIVPKPVSPRFLKPLLSLTF